MQIKKDLVYIFFFTEIFNKVMVVYWRPDRYKRSKQKRETKLFNVFGLPGSWMLRALTNTLNKVPAKWLWGKKNPVLLLSNIAWGRH